VANDKDFIVKNGLAIGTSLSIAGTTVTSSAAELNILDGVTADYIEINLLDTAVAGTIVNSKTVIYGAAGEVNATTLQIAGSSITATAAELNLIDGSVVGTIVNSKAVIYGAAGEVNATTLQIAGTSITSSAVELNYNDITTLGTVQASKTVTADALSVVLFPDNATAVFGTGSDLQIYHDGTHSRIVENNATGQLKIQGNLMQLLSSDGTTTYLEGNSSTGSVTLYHLANAPRIATTATGVAVTGEITSATIQTTGNIIVGGDLTVNGTTTTVNSTIVSIDDKNIELGSVAIPDNTTADGGGITLKGATDKTFNWVNATTAWTSSENLALAAGKTLRLLGSSSGTATIAASAAAGTPTLTLPTATGTFALLQDKLSVFASTTSAELAGVISDETGTGALVFASSPALLGTPTAPTAGSGTNTTQIATTSFVQGAIAGTYITKTSNYTALAGDRILTDTSGGIFSITLPSTPTTGDTVILYDITNWESNNLTVARNGSTIEGVADDFILDLGQIKVDFVYSGTTWQVYAAVGHAGPAGIAGPSGVDTPVSTTVALAIALG
tara:strand:+ start:800 stop:2479 length:1680 start_codon:yes stop_codon:yes gene_type:complete